jgi:CcmD family protein
MKKLSRLLKIISLAAVVLAAPAAALAQEFQKVDETKKLADNVPAVPFVGIAYGVIWLAVLVYVLAVARGLGRVNSELDELKRKIGTTLESAGVERK